MKINKDNLELSGKGAVISGEILHENTKLTFDQTQLFEVVIPDEEGSRQFGWLVPNTFEIIADFTTHTDKGMKGKSTYNSVQKGLLIDGMGLLQDLIPQQLVDMDTEEVQQILDQLLDNDDKFSGNLNFDKEDEDALLIISPSSKLIFVQTDDSSIRLDGDDGIFVLKRGDVKDSLVIIDQSEGIDISGDKNISIGPNGIYIDDKILDLEHIFDQVTRSLETSLASISMTGDLLGNIGKTIGQNFGKNFGKNFNKNFNKNFKFDDEDWDDAFDVDIDF